MDVGGGWVWGGGGGEDNEGILYCDGFPEIITRL